jgi:hypothetical protein
MFDQRSVLSKVPEKIKQLPMAPRYGTLRLSSRMSATFSSMQSAAYRTLLIAEANLRAEEDWRVVGSVDGNAAGCSDFLPDEALVDARATFALFADRAAHG